MLDQAMKDQITGVFADLTRSYTFVISVNESHPNRDELISLLMDVASCSDRIDCRVEPGKDLSFSLWKDNSLLPLVFRAVPTGHEFTSLLLLVLNADGKGKNLPDAALVDRIKRLKGPVEVKSYISLTCTNCPDVVQSLNVLALLNPSVHHEIVDGGINQEEVERMNIQAVPTVYANGQLLHVGRASLGELLIKLEEQVGTASQVSEPVLREFDVVVAGGGPAGISAAIYSARKGLSVAIVADRVGGQLNETVGIENMISMAHTTGSLLTANLRDHLGQYPVAVFENRQIEGVSLAGDNKHLQTAGGETFVAPALIVSTGASWRRLNVPGESQYIGSGVAFCAHCDGPFYKGKRVVVVGGGNSGLEAAVDLSALASDVTVLEYMPELKDDQVLQEKLKGTSNVKVITNVQTLEVVGDGTKVTGLRYKDRESGREDILHTDGIFVQIGLTANSQSFKEVVETNRFGEIVVDAHCRTSHPGIYAAGDVTTVPYKQIVIAMGEGAKAALSAFEDRIKGLLGSDQNN